MNKAVLFRYALIGIGGALGSMARYGVSGFVQVKWGGDFPLGTLAVNLIGCYFIGVLMSLVEDHQVLGPDARMFFGVGVLGGFTTFSTFGYETSNLIGDRRIPAAGGNILASVGVGLIAVAMGRMTVRLLRA